jgi:hypothetical protein
VFAGVNLNLNFPSVVGTVQAGAQVVGYGYSSGIYTRFVSHKTPVCSVSAQEAIDALGGSKAWSAWKKRFDLAYEGCLNENVTLVVWRPLLLNLGGTCTRNTANTPKASGRSR